MISIIGLKEGKAISPFKYVVSYSGQHKKFRNKQVSFAYMQLTSGQLSQLSLYQICRPKFRINRRVLTVLNFRNQTQLGQSPIMIESKKFINHAVKPAKN